MRLSKFIILLLLLCTLEGLVAPTAAEAQRSGKVQRVGVLALGLPPQFGDFRQRLRDLGYVEGNNLVIEYRLADGKANRLPELAADLVRSKVDVIVAVFLTPTRAAHQATRSIPIVMIAAGDPVGIGLVASLARPGGNVTGTVSYLPELGGKPLELLKELLPDLKRLAILWNPSNPVHEQFLRDAATAAATLTIQLRPVPAQSVEELARAFRTAARDAGAVWVLGDAMFVAQRDPIIALAATERLPALYPARPHVEAGGLISYGPHVPTMFREAANYVDKILKGAKPDDLPIQQPTRFDLVINLKTAKALGLTVPRSLLLRADQLIE